MDRRCSGQSRAGRKRARRAPGLTARRLISVLAFSTHAFAWIHQDDGVPVRAEDPRDVQTLTDDHLERLVKADPPPWTSVAEGHLGKLLIPRVSGTKNSTLVQEYISGVMTGLGWHEEQASLGSTSALTGLSISRRMTPFKWDTPIGETSFNNLIYTFDPEAPRKIIIAAHFDSKYFPTYPQSQFIGATDSAAPCSFMLDLAQSLTPMLQERKARIQNGQAQLRDGFDEEEAAETTLQLLFLDGEEAFKDWTDTDSIYGARYLAEHWANTYLPPTHPLVARKRRFDPQPSVLNTINVFVLLDLLGHSSPRINSFYRETDWLHALMSSADKRLQEKGLVEVEKGEEAWFSDVKLPRGLIGDDHVPFNQRGVSILHIISNPFPRVWHTIKDDASALSLPAMNRWNSILRVFTAEYLGLTPGQSAAASKRSVDASEDEDDREPTTVSGNGHAEGDLVSLRASQSS